MTFKSFIRTCCLLFLFCSLPNILYADQTGTSGPIIYSAPEEWAPMILPPKDGSNSQGLFIEILNEIFTKKLGLPVQYSHLPWKRAQLAVKRNEADLLLTVPTADRLTYTVASKEPVFKLYLHVYTYKNHPKLDNITQIKSVSDIRRLGLIPISNRGNGWHKENIDAHGIDTYYVNRDENIIKVLAAKRGDIMIDAVIPMNYLIKKHKLSHKIVLTPVKFGPVNFHLLVGKQSPFKDLLPEIDNIIHQLTIDKTLDRLATRYMSPE